MTTTTAVPINRSGPTTPPQIPWAQNVMQGAFGNANRAALALSRGFAPEQSFAGLLQSSPLMQQYLTAQQQQALSDPRMTLEQNFGITPGGGGGGGGNPNPNPTSAYNPAQAWHNSLTPGQLAIKQNQGNQAFRQSLSPAQLAARTAALNWKAQGKPESYMTPEFQLVLKNLGFGVG